MRNLDKSLGDGGMPLLAQLGLSFERYGEGWAEATWTPTELACNPLGPCTAASTRWCTTRR